MLPGRIAALVAATVLLVSGTAEALVLCTMPDGKTYAGDTPPEGCVEKKIEGLGQFVGKHDSKYDPEGVEPDSLEAAQIRATKACKEGIVRELKTPSAATFVEPFSVSHTGGWNFAITGDVDSQTAQGAMLRAHFTCEAHFVGGDEWKMKIQLGENAWPMVNATPNRAAVRAAAALEIARRRSIQAVAVQRMVNKLYSNGYFVEGTVANGADFAVYAVRICFDQGRFCQYTAPPTLQPGAQGTFSFATVSPEIPDWRITWDVVPPGAE